MKLCKTTPDANEDEVVQVQHDRVQCYLSNNIVMSSWEEIQFNQNQHVLGYDKSNNFHILDNSKPV